MINQVIQGDCLEVLKTLEENSVDSIVCDPPYELGFMGKSWDNTGIANNPLMWAECLRVLKPGGHLLSFGGTRTYHRMAVAIEDAGFEVRDMIEWVYGSGFPKSLNIGKAVDKLQGNEREVVGENQNIKGRNIRDIETLNVGAGAGNNTDITKGTSEWEGWGTALKPAHEPICMARKPLGQQELDIAKNICYNIIEKGFITNSKIIWRINNVKSAEKQKTKQSSTPTQQQKMVVVSAEFVETKENESVGKKIQKLIENICESTVKKTAKKQTKELQNTTEQIEKEYSNLIKPIKENEKRTQSKNMGVNVSAVEKQTLSSLPLTTLEVEEDSTEKKSKMETSMSSLKSTDTQKTDTDYSAQTATSQWVCMDIVRTLKVSFEGKEYDFIELSDGSLVWNENLEPYRKQQKLNVAENVLKYGTGGINIDESRVEGKINPKDYGRGGGFVFRGDSEDAPKPNTLGRFPANLITDGSDEVRECFPETKDTHKNEVRKFVSKKRGDGFLDALTQEGEHTTRKSITDSGNASRFFKSIIYQAKASKSNRGEGNNHATVKPTALMEYLIKMVSREGQTILDPFAGSGTTGVACKNLGRNFILIEKEQEYIDIINKRLYTTPQNNTSVYIEK